MLKYSKTLAVSVTINLSIKLGFVPVNGPRETYLWTRYIQLTMRGQLNFTVLTIHFEWIYTLNLGQSDILTVSVYTVGPTSYCSIRDKFIIELCNCEKIFYV